MPADTDLSGLIDAIYDAGVDAPLARGLLAHRAMHRATYVNLSILPTDALLPLDH